MQQCWTAWGCGRVPQRPVHQPLPQASPAAWQTLLQEEWLVGGCP